MEGDQVADDGEADARTGLVRFPVALEPHEFLPDAVSVAGGNSRTFVFDGEPDGVGFPRVGEAMWEALEAGGVGAAVTRYRDLKQKRPGDYNFGVDQIALVGNRLLQHRRLREAIENFRLASAEAPGEAVLQARIGEASAALGDREGSLAAYRKALEIAPLNPEAMEMVRRLEPSVSEK